MGQQGNKHGNLRFFASTFLPHEFRCSANHKPADKYGDDDKNVIVEKAYTYTAEKELIIIPSIASMPPKGVKLSCMALTDPLT